MLQVVFAVEQLQSYQEEKKKAQEKNNSGKITMESLSKFDWLKGLEKKGGKIQYKKIKNKK